MEFFIFLKFYVSSLRYKYHFRWYATIGNDSFIINQFFQILQDICIVVWTAFILFLFRFIRFLKLLFINVILNSSTCLKLSNITTSISLLLMNWYVIYQYTQSHSILILICLFQIFISEFQYSFQCMILHLLEELKFL